MPKNGRFYTVVFTHQRFDEDPIGYVQHVKAVSPEAAADEGCSRVGDREDCTVIAVFAGLHDPTVSDC